MPNPLLSSDRRRSMNVHVSSTNVVLWSRNCTGWRTPMAVWLSADLRKLDKPTPRMESPFCAEVKLTAAAHCILPNAAVTPLRSGATESSRGETDRRASTHGPKARRPPPASTGYCHQSIQETRSPMRYAAWTLLQRRVWEQSSPLTQPGNRMFHVTYT